jgi:hypothetical protein
LDRSIAAKAQIVSRFLVTPEREGTQALAQCAQHGHGLAAFDKARKALPQAGFNESSERIEIKSRVSPTGVRRVPLRRLIQNKHKHRAFLSGSRERRVIFQTKIPLEPNHLNLRMLTFGHD